MRKYVSEDEMKQAINNSLKNALPEVTEENNGQILGVVNGKWTGVELESFEEVTL